MKYDLKDDQLKERCVMSYETKNIKEIVEVLHNDYDLPLEMSHAIAKRAVIISRKDITCNGCKYFKYVHTEHPYISHKCTLPEYPHFLENEIGCDSYDIG